MQRRTEISAAARTARPGLADDEQLAVNCCQKQQEVLGSYRRKYDADAKHLVSNQGIGSSTLSGRANQVGFCDW